MSNFRDVVALMLKSLKEQYDQILTDTTTPKVTRTMVKFKVELDILAQYVKSQNITDIDATTFDGLLEMQLNDSACQQSEGQQIVNIGEGNTAQIVKTETPSANAVDNIQPGNIFPIVRHVNQSIFNDSLNDDTTMYDTSTPKSLKTPRGRIVGRPKKAESLNKDTTVKRRGPHKAVHSGKKFRCKYCPQTYLAKQGLQYHIEAKHPKAGCSPARFKCDQCPANYSYIGNLRAHQKNKQHGNQS